MSSSEYLYSCRTMIGNWFEERASHDAIIQKYMDGNGMDLKSAHVLQQMENIVAPESLSEGKVLFPGDSVLLICHNTKPLMLANDPRRQNKEYANGCCVSLLSAIAPMRRSVFRIVRAGEQRMSDTGLLKYGTRLGYMFKDEEGVETKMSTISLNNAVGEDVPICYGERVHIQASQELVKNSDFFGDVGDEKIVLGCPHVFSTAVIPVVVARLTELGRDAEFTIEPYHVSVRLEMEGKPVLFDQPVVLRHCATGQCLGTGVEMLPDITDLKDPEIKCMCKSVISQYKREDANNLFTITVGQDTFDDKGL